MKGELTQAEVEYLNAHLVEYNPIMLSICQKVIRMAKEDKAVELGEIVSGTTEWCAEENEPTEDSYMPKGSFSFSVNIENTPELERFLNEHKEPLQKAQKMLERIKYEQQNLIECRMRGALTRPTRRKLEKRLRERIEEFNTYCKKHNLKISKEE